MNDTIIIGIDHGYAAMKTAHFSFPTGLVEYEHEPYTRKDVLELEEKHLIRTEPTTVITRDGRKRNGTLRYHIRPIQEAVDHYYERQLSQLELDTERQRAQARLSRLCAAQEPLPAAGQPMTPPTAERGVSGLCGPACEVGGLNDLPDGQMNRGVEKCAG